MFNNFFGMEAISFQTSSQLGKDLTDIFQEVIDFKHQVSKSIADRTDRIVCVIDFVNKTMVPKFIKTVENNLGFKIKNVIVNGDSYNGKQFPEGKFAILLNINSYGDTLANALANMTGATYNNAPNKYQYAEHIKELANCIDLYSGKLTKKTLSNGLPIYINDVYFDALHAFLLDEFIEPDNAHLLEFEAKEITAIMLHELGHIMTVIEHLSDLYVVNSRIRNDTVNIRQMHDIDGAKELLKEIDTTLIPHIVACANSAGTVDKAVKNTTLKTIAMVNGLNKVLNFAAKDKTTTGVVSITSITKLIGELVLGLTGYVYVKNIHAEYNSDGEKSSDRRNNSNNLFLLERWADEFVARHGYGNYAASAFNKMNKLDEYYRTINASRDVSAYKIATNTSIKVSIYIYIAKCFTIFNYLEPVTYETEYNRLKRLLQDTKGIFKEKQLPTNCVYDWIKKCEDIHNEMQNCTKHKDDNEASPILANIIYALINKPVNLYKLIKDGKLDKDCAILEDRIDDMRNNTLFMMSHMFRTM